MKRSLVSSENYLFRNIFFGGDEEVKDQKTVTETEPVAVEEVMVFDSSSLFKLEKFSKMAKKISKLPFLKSDIYCREYSF